MLEAGDQANHAEAGADGIEEKKARRLRFMIGLYDMVEGLDARSVRIDQIATRLSLDSPDPGDRLEVVKQVRYLHGEELITVSGPLDNVKAVALTHRGVREVEQAMSEPDRPTEHFPPLDNVLAHNVNGSARQGGSATANTLAILSEQERLEVLRLVQSLKDWTDQLALDELQRSEYEADLSTIEAQMDSPQPKKDLIEAALGSVRHIVVRVRNPSGSVADIVSTGIVSTIDRFVARL